MAVETLNTDDSDNGNRNETETLMDGAARIDGAVDTQSEARALAAAIENALGPEAADFAGDTRVPDHLQESLSSILNAQSPHGVVDADAVVPGEGGVAALNSLFDEMQPGETPDGEPAPTGSNREAFAGIVQGADGLAAADPAANDGAQVPGLGSGSASDRYDAVAEQFLDPRLASESDQSDQTTDSMGIDTGAEKIAVGSGLVLFGVVASGPSGGSSTALAGYGASVLGSTALFAGTTAKALEDQSADANAGGSESGDSSDGGVIGAIASLLGGDDDEKTSENSGDTNAKTEETDEETDVEGQAKSDETSEDTDKGETETTPKGEGEDEAESEDQDTGKADNEGETSSDEQGTRDDETESNDESGDQETGERESEDNDSEGNDSESSESGGNDTEGGESDGPDSEDDTSTPHNPNGPNANTDAEPDLDQGPGNVDPHHPDSGQGGATPDLNLDRDPEDGGAVDPHNPTGPHGGADGEPNLDFNPDQDGTVDPHNPTGPNARTPLPENLDVDNPGLAFGAATSAAAQTAAASGDDGGDGSGVVRVHAETDDAAASLGADGDRDIAGDDDDAAAGSMIDDDGAGDDVGLMGVAAASAIDAGVAMG